LTAAALIADHRAAGREFSAAGVRSFVRCEGSGDDVLCLHGIPASSFLYRKVLPELAERGLRGVAFDLPGLGLAARPATFSYTWTGHGAWCAAAVDELRLDTFHLVVHDYGGPVGFELCARAPDRIRSLTILNTVVDVEAFHRPWLVELLARRGIGEAVLQAVPHIVFRTVLTRLGIGDRRGIGDIELDAWLDLLRGTDRGRALLRMARDLERTREKRDLYVTTLRELSVPVQIVWGVDDPILRVDVHGEQARAATGAPLHRLPGRHFLQEDCFEAIGEHVARLAAATSALS
jgi:haloalkane dehalogenase